MSGDAEPVTQILLKREEVDLQVSDQVGFFASLVVQLP